MRPPFRLRAPWQSVAGLGALLAVSAVAPSRAPAQEIGSLLSPGKLSKAHASLEGLANCEKCHEPGKKVTAEKCLACHRPVAERIAAGKGVHRDVKGDCVSCHVEHAGVDAELRPFDPKKFDHKAETGFALDGLHAPLAARCESCHKTRSFLGLKPDCASCHKDVHQGRLGAACASCHSTSARFAEARRVFDHSKTSFPLTGAHQAVRCEQCHKTSDYRVLQFGACSDCHKSPHEKPLGLCSSCHTTESWRGTRKIDHAKTGFPLVGRHASAPCASCHVQPATKVHLKFGRCADCHRDPHNGAFKEDCASCHKETGFAGAPFDHLARTGFALDDGHAKVACAACHKGAARPAAGVVRATVDFRGARKDCASCHRDVHQGELGSKCESCHSPRSFKVPSFKHPRFPEFFTTAHAQAACEKCHRPAAAAAGAAVTRLFKGVSLECAGCHRDVHMGQLGARCETCHTVKSFAVAGYRHQRPDLVSFFAGKHAAAACQDCHKPKESGVAPAGRAAVVLFKGVATDCAACHRDVHRGVLGTRCESCHAVSGWKNASRAFHKAGLFPLEGKHLSVPCASCHWNGVLKGTPRLCYDCHWVRHKDDRFQTRLGRDCENCHRPTAWTDVSWDHGAMTGFPLSAAHKALACESCHRGQVFTAAQSECLSCHRPVFTTAKQPDHVAMGFPTDCQACHRPGDTSWHQGRFDHAASFALVGTHATQPCASCHKGGVYKGTSRDCVGCHKPQYVATKSPAHASAGFSTTCETCHKATDATWDLGKFDHNSTFALVGVHSAQPCSACHKGGVYKGTSRDCVGCHKPQYDATKNPAHTAAGFPTTCETCHKATDATWDLGKFDHNSTFALVGVHSAQPCSACHKGGVYKGTSRDCVGCHKPQYDATKNPAHVAAGFPTTCDTCHKATDATWTLAAAFNHTTQTTFPLVGAHSGPPCTACHASGVYKGLSTACSTCHMADFNAAKSPVNHAGFSTACESCHRVADPTWSLASAFNHTTRTSFPLVGAHVGPACTKCHVSGVYKGLSTVCSTCHMADFNAAKSPVNHAGFSTACATCHKVSDLTWSLASAFNHSTQTTFPLVGQHATQPCTACHASGVFKGLSTTCSSCHMAQYTASKNPNHAAAGFPTTCETCHKASDASWTLGKFNHTAFPITSGPHAGQVCSACHTNPTNFAVFSCVTCHGRSETDSHHRGVSGYVYDSRACYSCHPTGRSD